jgi:hypothetical protein
MIELFYDIAMAFFKPYHQRTNQEKDMTQSGICYAVLIHSKGNVDYHKVHDLVYKAHYELVGHWLPRRYYDGDWKREHDYIRGMFCLLMVEMLKDGEL